MSNLALNWAFDAPLRGSLKSVLVALANHADEGGKCFPSITRLALSSGLSRRAVITAIVQLEALGYIETEKKHRTATQYQMTMMTQQSGEVSSPKNPANLVKSVHSKEGAECGDLVNLLHPTGELSSPQPLLTQERKKEEKIPPIIPHKGKTRKPLDGEPPGFHEFYSAYPRKDEPRAAAKAFAAAIKRGATVEEIMAGLATYQFSDDPHWHPMPTTWLNGNRWLHKPSPAPKPKLTTNQKVLAAFGLFEDEEIPTHNAGLLQ